MALVATAGCGGGGNDTKFSSNIVGPWFLAKITTPSTNSSSGTMITCPGSISGYSCSVNQKISFTNNGTYEAFSDSIEEAAGVYNLNGNLLTVKYQYISVPSVTYTNTYLAYIVLSNSSTTVNTLFATLSSTNDPAFSGDVGVQFTYGFE